VARCWAGVLAALLLVGCGGEAPVTPGTQTSGSSGSAAGPGAPLSPGPDIPEDAQVSPDELIISVEGGDTASAEKAARAAGGSVQQRDERIGIVVARFPVAGLPELIEIRDELRAQGFDAAVNPVIQDPTAG